MAKYEEIFETETLRLHRRIADQKYWLWDETRGMNLAMKADSERDAFIEALEYYQRRLTEVEGNYNELSKKVQHFLDQFKEDEFQNDD